jgi:hypothetical protein
MPIAQIGPFTSIMESAAAAVAAGMLLGGFLTGLVGLMRGFSRQRFDWLVMQSGYIGGAGSLFVILADITLRHAS